MGIPEDISLIEANINKLIHEYEQFFLGAEKGPRNRLNSQSAVERLIRKYSNQTIGNAALRFRYQNLVHRYNSLKQLWDRRLRMREEGIVIGARARSFSGNKRPLPPIQRKKESYKEKSQSSKKPVKPKLFNATTREPQKEKEIVNSIYNQYMNAQKKSGSPIKKVSKEGFQKLISKQVQAIKKAHKCSAVNFRVQIQDGQVKLKAKPIND